MANTVTLPSFASKARQASRRAVVYAVANQKGGVGKTTTAQALGAALADLGDRTLLVDLDPQGSLTDACGLTPAELSPTIYDLVDQFVRSGSADPGSAILMLDERLALLPSNLHLARAEMALQSAPRREYVLRQLIDPIRADWDWILLDCPPSLSVLTTNALVCADRVIIPIMPEPMGLSMVPSFLETVDAIRLERMNPRLEIAGIILTRSSARALVSQAAVATLQEWFDGSVPILGEIRDSAKVQEAPSRGIPVSRYRAARQAADEYRRIAEVLRDTREQRTD